MIESSLESVVASRICHDLINPIGAVGNGLELLELTGLPQSPELSLLQESVAGATAKLKYFRVAFGHAEPDTYISPTEVQKICKEMFSRDRWQLSWQPAPSSLLRPRVKIMLLLLLCMESSMPLGGALHIDEDRIDATCPKVNLEGNHWDCLSSAPMRPQVSSRHVQFVLLQSELARQNVRIATSFRTDGMSARVTSVATRRSNFG